MSGMLNGFDWNGETSQPSEGMTPLPVGVYYFTVAEANEKITKAGTGQYLELQFECLDDEHKGRKVYATFNLVNKNSQAVQIAQKEFVRSARLAENSSQARRRSPVTFSS